MELTEEQKQTLRQIYGAKGDALEAVMFKRLVERGIDEQRARTAARECSNRIWRYSMFSGAFTTVALATLYTPVVGIVAGSSMGTIVGWQTLLHSEACRDIRDFDLQEAVNRVNAGF